LPAHVDGVARVNFQEICGRPLGPADFEVIARHVEILFLDDVPYLGKSLPNEARRFVWLVDAIYRNGGLLIIRAESPLESLFHSELSSEGTVRLKSRLVEMGSASWMNNLQALRSGRVGRLG
jgi:cell division protein ZapE